MGLLSRLVVKCVRSTTSLAVTMDLALGQVILLLVVSSLVGANSETFRVSSTGDAARIQGSKMGDYMPTSYAAIQGTTKPTSETVATAVCSTANPPVAAAAVTGTATVTAAPKKVLCNLVGPHLIVNSNDSCPPESGWSFKVGPTGTGTALFKKTDHVSVTALP